ncbi:MAG: GIY-YIG nuclease family protein [Planctomycetota bacterium]
MTNKRLRKSIGDFPEKPGIYMMRDRGNDIIYVGKAKSLKHRVASYFNKALDNKTLALMSRVKDIEYKTTGSEIEALLLESRFVRDTQPKYNMRLRDDKSFPVIAISKDEFPRVFILRERGIEKDKGVEYFGPFINVKNLQSALKILQRIFRFRVCRRMDNKKGCLLCHIGLCSAPCLGKISQADYQSDIELLKHFLDGDADEHKSVLLSKIKNAEFQGRAELVVKYRRQMDIFNRMTQGNAPREQMLNPDKLSGMEAIQRELGMVQLPRSMVATDISDIKGTAAVGAIVTFIDGLPYKDGYRRYRIKTAIEGRADDYYRIKEVMTRYIRRQIEENNNFPDIILVDGGKGHLRTVADVLGNIKSNVKGLTLPILAALAKKNETLYTVKDGKIKETGVSSEGMKIFQYLRDEAHRFAQAYHHLLRRKALVKR